MKRKWGPLIAMRGFFPAADISRNIEHTPDESDLTAVSWPSCAPHQTLILEALNPRGRGHHRRGRWLLLLRAVTSEETFYKAEMLCFFPSVPFPSILFFLSSRDDEKGPFLWLDFRFPRPPRGGREWTVHSEGTASWKVLRVWSYRNMSAKGSVRFRLWTQ